jgi:hypothetical protein
VDFLRRRTVDPKKRVGADRAIAAALKLFEENGASRWELEGRLIARESDATISKKMGLARATIATYACLFFAVRSCPQATD